MTSAGNTHEGTMKPAHWGGKEQNVLRYETSKIRSNILEFIRISDQIFTRKADRLRYSIISSKGRIDDTIHISDNNEKQIVQDIFEKVDGHVELIEINIHIA